MTAKNESATSTPTPAPKASSTQSKTTIGSQGEKRAVLAGMGLAGIQFAGLTILAIAQPIFDQIGSTPEFFKAHHSSALDAWILVIALTFVPAVGLLVLSGCFRFAGEKAFSIATSVIVGMLAGVYALLVLRWATKDALGPGWGVILPGIVGLVMGTLYYRGAAVRQFLTIISIVSFIYPALFIINSSHVLFRSLGIEEDATEAVQNPQDLVVIIFDELPSFSLLNAEAEIDARRFPNFARLAATSTWYPKATSVWPYTALSVTAILTGVLPRLDPEHAQRTREHNLFTMLGSGYNYNVSEPVTSFFPSWKDDGLEPLPLQARIKFLATDLAIIYLNRALPPELRRNVPDIDLQWGNFLGDADLASASGVGQLKEVLDSVADRPAPTANIVHAIFPHYPWEYLPDGRTYNATPRGPIKQSRARRLMFPQPLVDHIQQRHLLQLGYGDRILGTMLDRLEEAGRLEDAMIVIVADHGIGFKTRREAREYSYRIIPRLMFVPLIIKYPGQTEGEVSALRATTVDVLPTIAQALGAGEGWEFDGVALRDPDYPNTDTKPLNLSQLRGDRVGLPNMDKTFSADVMYEKLKKDLDSQAEAFWLNEPEADFFRLGPYASLLGEAAAEASFMPLAAKFTDDDAWDDVDPESNFIPVLIAGYLVSPPGEVAPSSYVGLVVNGTISGTSGLAEIRGKLYFSAIAHPTTFRRGANEVGVVLLGKEGGAQ